MRNPSSRERWSQQTFDDIGLLSGFGGCNNYSSAYRVGEEYDVVEGGTIQFAGIASGNKACEADAMAQEDNYFAAIGGLRRRGSSAD